MTLIPGYIITVRIRRRYTRLLKMDLVGIDLLLLTPMGVLLFPSISSSVSIWIPRVVRN